MGKRRDSRRQQQASSRRVKLDLFVDEVSPPSETSGSLEVPDSALGEDLNAGAKNQEGGNNDNPLSLLGQYSDDEADEEHDIIARSLQDLVDEARKDSSEFQDEKKDIRQNQVTDKISVEEDQSTNIHDDDGAEQESRDPEIRVQDATVDNEWQPVLDEGSGEYYYWNVRTGETTWVKPVEGENVNKEGSSPVQDLDSDSLLGRNPKRGPNETHIQNNERDSSFGDNNHDCEGTSIKKEERSIMCLQSIQNDSDNSNARFVSNKDKVAGEAAENLDEIRDSESPAHSTNSHLGSVNAEGGVLEEHEGKEVEEESLPVQKDAGGDFNAEVTNKSQGTPDRDPYQIETIMTCRSSPSHTIVEELDTRQVVTKEAQRSIEEKMASLVQRGELLHYRLNVLARHSSGEVSRHLLMASQTEVRLTDWKAFSALGFVPDACLSFMQGELTQLELILASEEAAELERQKLVESASALEALHAMGPEIKDSNWVVNWPYQQQDSGTALEPWNQGQPMEVPGHGNDVEEGEIRTCYSETYPGYAGVSEDTTAFHVMKMMNGTGTEDVDMDVDMEVDDEVEVEPAVPGMTSEVAASDIPVPYPYACSFPGFNEGSSLAPIDPACVGELTHYYHTDSWAPPLPPDDEWAPPPPGESEPAPPPPPDEPPPLPQQCPEVEENYNLPSMSSEVQLQYYVPEYTVESNPPSQCVAVADYQSIIDSSVYGAYLNSGGVYSNCPQPAKTLEVEQPFVVVSASTQAMNGWAVPVLAHTASVPDKPPSSGAAVKASSYALPISSVVSTTAESTTAGASLETKKLPKGKTKKRTQAVAAAPILNKKVSSLVNKWKQAKEELHGGGGEEEEEDKTLYDVEALEKKRQKEIEEWRRQQIASGEALDNANFQPLGTLDWRERVKRARKADSKEKELKGGATGSVVSSSVVEGQKVECLKPQKPNMTELSKGLPSGWQAYWDESSGEVYYGNLTTQETTWDKPVT